MLPRILIFDSWFAPKRSAEAMMDVGADIIGMVKINTKGFCKDITKNMKKYWTGGSYFVFRRNHMMPVDRLLTDIGYTSNYWKVLSFIATEGTGSTKYGIPYLSKYP